MSGPAPSILNGKAETASTFLKLPFLSIHMEFPLPFLSISLLWMDFRAWVLSKIQWRIIQHVLNWKLQDEVSLGKVKLSSRKIEGWMVQRTILSRTRGYFNDEIKAWGKTEKYYKERVGRAQWGVSLSRRSSGRNPSKCYVLSFRDWRMCYCAAPWVQSQEATLKCDGGLPWWSSG